MGRVSLRNLGLAYLALMALAVVLTSPSSAQEPYLSAEDFPAVTLTATPTVAPLRPAAAIQEEQDPRLGFIPPEADLPPIEVQAPAVLPLAARFDWREAGMVTAVKNQGPCGSCYAFASLGNMESRLLLDGSPAYDFSENYAKECEWFGSSCSGGNYWRVANILTSQGAVLEACDPYVASDVACNDSCPHAATLLDWREFSHETVAPTATIKSYIQTYGPVYTAMNAGHSDTWAAEFDDYDGSYTLYYAGAGSANHAVLIVGWDDSLSHAGGQGAWIVKNSWGTSWGGTCGYGSERGYFTIAYGSAMIGSWASFAQDWKAFDPQDAVLLYDDAGYTNSVGYGVTTAWGFCKYVAEENFTIDRVEFWTADATTDIDVYVYDTFNGVSLSGLLASSLNNSFDLPGYHSIEIPARPHITSGNDVFIALKFTDATYKYPLVFDGTGPRTPLTSYISSNGSMWSEWPQGDLGIRLRVSREISCGVVTAEPVISTIADVPADDGGQVRLSWRRSIYDSEGSSPKIKRYRIWRRVVSEGGPSLLGAAMGGSGGGSGLSTGGPREYGEDSPAWELVGTVRATGSCNYSFDAPTVCDGESCATEFRVVAHTGEVGNHFDSPIASGYSLDNLSGGSEGGPTPIDPDPSVPSATRLLAPRPNPGADAFAITLELAARGWVQVCVFDIMGRRVATLLDGSTAAGAHTLRWDGKIGAGQDAAPGVYFARLVTAVEVQTVKLILVR